ncbi:MAG: heat-inducible transcriptional repressor HrcA, partial [Gammaproteobacteria bacterium]|nr:heat-inducible transcriptional repressor HrcA [Gammaproteobacteria bacterium]
YRLFVDSLLRVTSLDQQQIDRIAKELDPQQDVKNLMEKTSSTLSEITHLASIVTLPRTESKSLRHVEFVALSENRILVILVVNDREIQNRIINTARVYTVSELQQATNFLNEKFAGKSLDTIREDILRELESMKDNVNQLMQMAIEMAQKAFERGQDQDDYVMAGHTNLMDVAELSDVEKLKKLFESFNQKRDILHLLEQSIQARGVQIFIGEESGYDVLDECSVVTSPYEVNGEIMGVLGVIGPTRMQYQRVIPIVDITAKMLGSALNSRQ